MKKLLAALALSALATTQASAALYLGATGGAGHTVTDYSESGLISFDLDLANKSPISLNYQLTAADIGSLAFNAILRNYTGTGIDHFSFRLTSGTFDFLGTVTRSFGGTSSVSLYDAGATAQIAFSSPEYLDVPIGNPGGTGAGQVDWSILTSSLQAGDQLSLSIAPSAVPLPAALPLMLAGLGALQLVARRRKSKD
jgi:hypothetical protein